MACSPLRVNCGCRQLAGRHSKVLYRLTVDQVLLNDPFKHLRRAVPVPGAFRINDGYRPIHAQLQAVRLAAVDPALLGQAELFESPFQIFPRFQALLPAATFGLGLIAAEQNMTPDRIDAELTCLGVQRCRVAVG